MRNEPFGPVMHGDGHSFAWVRRQGLPDFRHGIVRRNRRGYEERCAAAFHINTAIHSPPQVTTCRSVLPVGGRGPINVLSQNSLNRRISASLTASTTLSD